MRQSPDEPRSASMPAVSHLRRIARWLMPRPAASPPLMQATNLTRQCELAARLSIAASAGARRKGLLGRNGLGPGEGLWILPCEAVHSFGMRFAIDLIYLDRHQRVLKVKGSVPPRRVSACLLAHSVLELPAGTIATSRTQPGDLLQIQPIPAAATGSSADT